MKKKLRLHAEELRVETFATAREDGDRGTVRAHAVSEPDYPTCAKTCGIPPAIAPYRATYGCEPPTADCCM